MSVNHLATGGQKSVYAVDHKHHGKSVLKLFQPNTNPERALRELTAIAQVQSPSVPGIFETGICDYGVGHVVWLLEEWIDGGSLRDRLSKQLPDTSLVLRVGLHTLECLVVAERQQIVHRDIKPDNILVSIDESQCWVTDFGIARHLGLASLTRTDSPMGLFTPGYAPAEQFMNIKDDIDGRADLFALGITLFECIEGNNPFRIGAADGREILNRVQTITLPRVTLRAGMPLELADLIFAMTRPRRNHRITTVGDAYEWMREIAAGQGIL